jgi:hypothetical protein
MSRAAYCRQQAALCRGLADQISVSADAKHLHAMASKYEAEADSLDGTSQQGLAARKSGED